MDVVTDVVVPDVPGFELGAVLGRGATSEVWAAVREADGRRVAVKVTGADPELTDAAVREAAVSARVASEHVLAVEACVPLPDGRTALVMPLLDGGSLAALVRARGHLSPGEVVTVLAPVASALGRLHAAGVVHGDVSPGNVLLDLDGRPVLADLGLGRVVGEADTPVWGTEGHLAPEVLLGADPSPAADVYALGALGWMCLAGEVPGAPGLRPTLAEVNRAGEGAAPLLAVVESAVAPRARERPSADDLAWALFEAAQAAPLHLVDGTDDVSSVTYRLRAAAGAPDGPEDDASSSGRSPVARAAATVERAGGLVRGLRPRSRRRARHGAGTRRSPLLVGAAALLGAAVAVVGVLAVPRAAEPTVSVRAPVTSSGAPAVTGSGTSTVMPQQASAPGDDPRLDRAVDARPDAVLRTLADARARAWAEADPEQLGEAFTTGPMLERDARGVAELRRTGLRYDGLRYTVTEVRVVRSAESAATVRARLGTTGYAVAGGRTAVSHREAQAAQEVVVELVRDERGWRMADLRSA
ncbi:protein kinase [Phycicoccus sp. CSK15P-2]|uniref:serine/threonine-protein kinase n=1 Tax=Phycicoccus sp. CSK15P-2 TaxID=2807627 RepID=UPI00194EBA79|nr:protein kinase [Phycicoccus sp. CSK15P-2]MBM6404081.1 protein kinase [Phycicoccus sp. CSK15P-2]